jgi:hypothetical protein
MDRTFIKNGFLFIVMMALLAGVAPSPALAGLSLIDGLTGATFSFTAKDGHIRTSDGDSVYMWGYAPTDTGIMQYPGPTLIVDQNTTVSITLTNQLKVPVSMVFPGQVVTVTATTGLPAPGLLTTEVPPDNGVSSVTYTFTPSQPGTYTYFSGTNQNIQVEMGLAGAIIVRPTGFSATNPATWQAYADPSTFFDREFLMLLSEIDVELHRLVERGEFYKVDTTTRHPVTFFENGRTFPDTMADPSSSATVPFNFTAPYNLPNQPYNSNPMFHPAEKVLIRFVGATSSLHPLHTHGQNHLIIARDGIVLNSALNNLGPADLGLSDFTTTVVPGETADAIFGPWTGAKLGWDVYGDPTNPATAHTCTNPSGFDPVSHEWCPDHGKPIPVLLPFEADMAFGPMYGGTPFLGLTGSLPPVDPATGFVHTYLNPQAGLSFMWHSHAEREITTNNIFIGGMATMSLILPVSFPIPDPIKP